MVREQLKLQVPKEHYLFKNYDIKQLWMSYWYQIDEVLNTGSKNILEVGPGNGTVCAYLRREGLNVTTIDIDPNLKPDYVGSVTDLTKLFGPNAFDLILCSDVLEHIPFEIFAKTLTELYVVTNSYVMITLPYFGLGIRLSLRLPKIGEKNFKLKFPLPFVEHTFDGQHYWELGKKNYSQKKIVKILREKFEVIKHYYLAENMYRMVFLLKKH